MLKGEEARLVDARSRVAKLGVCPEWGGLSEPPNGVG